MKSANIHWNITLVVVMWVCFVFYIIPIAVFTRITGVQVIVVQNFKIIFLGILLEALPFLLLGILVSSIIRCFVSESAIRRITPNHPILGLLFACGLGMLLPVCECGLPAVVRRFLQSGMPLYITIVFMLCGPIANPIVFVSTYIAFPSHPEMAYLRMILAVFAALIVGGLVYRIVRNNPLKFTLKSTSINVSSRSLSATLSHAAEEMFETGALLVIGAIITALIQTLSSRESLLLLGHNGWTSHIVMMVYAFVLSLCSTSDAFVASSFSHSFSRGAILAFLVSGPMLNLKNAILLFSIFRTRFYFFLIVSVTVTVWLGSMALEWLIGL